MTVLDESGVLGLEPSKLAVETGYPMAVVPANIGGDIIPVGPATMLVVISGNPTEEPVPCISKGRLDGTMG